MRWRHGSTETMTAINPRSTRRYRKNTKLFREQCERENSPCWLYLQPIAYALRDHTDAFNVDHFYPVEDFPHLAEDPANFRASHQLCNQSRGKRKAQIKITHRSRVI